MDFYSLWFLFILSLHDSIVSVLGAPRLHFEPLKFLNFDFNADPWKGIQLFNLCGSGSSVKKNARNPTRNNVPTKKFTDEIEKHRYIANWMEMGI